MSSLDLTRSSLIVYSAPGMGTFASTNVDLLAPGDDPLHRDGSLGLPANRGRSLLPYLISQLPFLAVAVQFGMIVLLVLNFHLESLTFGRLMVMAFAGFLVHHFLPVRFRLPFFAFLSLAGTLAVAHLEMGLVLVAIGLSLIALCHLPIPFWSRVVLLCGAAAGLTVARIYSGFFPSLEGMWAILGSMFIFRILLYLYDMRYGTAPFSLARAISYFFMLPNVCFPLFPVVDYKTYCSSHYNDDALSIYQLGLKWMLRGVVQLLLYRLVYHFANLNIDDVTNIRKVAEYMVATYLLYLHVSGQFHLIVGLLRMFGFNLPETHHLYLLASSFTDFWRRINIYWKDFIMRLFFYPAFFALRKLGTLNAIALATFVAFFATWALHTWQWFWFRGYFLFSSQDILFWSALALLVIINAVYEAAAGRKRTLSKSTLSFWTRLRVALKTVGTFVVICSLWTLWSCQSWEELHVLAEASKVASWADVLIVVGGLAALGIASAIWGDSVPETSRKLSAAIAKDGLVHFWRAATGTGVAAALILGLLPLGLLVDRTEAARFLLALRQDQLNARDVDWQRRGYYEELDVVRANYRTWEDELIRPKDWTSPEIFRSRRDFLRRELVPLTSGKISGAMVTTNRWGMRDQDYEQEKPAGAYRIILIGSSHELGSGVEEDETFESRVETLLNESPPLNAYANYEILNMSVGGYGILRKLMHLERHGFDFSPDAVLFAVNANDRVFDLDDLSEAVRKDLPYPCIELADVFERAQIVGQLQHLVIKHRLQPFVPELYGLALSRLQRECSRRGIQVWVVYRAAVVDSASLETNRRQEVLSLAEDARLEIIDLSSAFDDVADRKALTLSPWDDHTNALGHKLLADLLYRELATRILEFIQAETAPSATAEQDWKRDKIVHEL